MYSFYDFKKGIKIDFIKDMWYFIEKEPDKVLLKFKEDKVFGKYPYIFEDMEGLTLLFDKDYLGGVRIMSVGFDEEVREKYPYYFI
jgi:hypothetical protein